MQRLALASQRLREEMRLRRISATRMAADLGIPQTTFSYQLRSGTVPLETIERAAGIMGIDPRDLGLYARPREGSTLVVREASPAVLQAEEWLSRIANPDLLRRQAGTPTGRDLIKGIKTFLFDLPWPVEEKNAVDALLNRYVADAQAPEH